MEMRVCKHAIYAQGKSLEALAGAKIPVRPEGALALTKINVYVLKPVKMPGTPT